MNLHTSNSLPGRFEFRPAAPNLSIGSGGIHVMAKTAIGIGPILRDFQFTGKEHDGDHALFKVGRLKRRYVAIDDGFTHRIAHVGSPGHGHVDAVELDLQFVMTESEYAKFALVVPVNTIGLRGGDNLMFLRRFGRSPCLGWRGS